MISNKPLDSLELEDIKNLIEYSVPESKIIEYKRDLNLKTGTDRKEFLGDISSFSNTIGGDIIFGIEEKEGNPVKIVGIEVEDIDKKKQQIESIIISGLEPRIPFNLLSIHIRNNRYVLIIRMEQSWIRPHRVILKSHDKFYMRHSSRKSSMDTNQLRRAFLSGQEIIDRIIEFKDERLSRIYDDKGSMVCKKGPKLVAHFIPLNSIQNQTFFELDMLPEVKPIKSTGYTSRVNIHGRVTYSSLNQNYVESYNQVFRNGIIEAVYSSLYYEKNNKNYVGIYTIESALINSFRDFIKSLMIMGIQPPIYLFLSLMKVKSFFLEIGAEFPYEESTIPFSESLYSYPEILINSLEKKPEDYLRPIIDMIWNTCGYEKSLNFDENNEWIG